MPCIFILLLHNPISYIPESGSSGVRDDFGVFQEYSGRFTTPQVTPRGEAFEPIRELLAKSPRPRSI